MKIIIPEIDHVFECEGDSVCSIVIENQQVFFNIISDLYKQRQGEDGQAVLSDCNKSISIEKHTEIISQFIPFDMNPKSLVSKINSRMQELSMDDVHYMKTNELVAEWERYLMDLSLGLIGNFEFSKVSGESLIKAAGIKIDALYDSLGEQLLDYFELVEEYDRKKLFVLVNLRSYLSDQEISIFISQILQRSIQIMLLESSEHPIVEGERRYILDKDKRLIC